MLETKSFRNCKQTRFLVGSPKPVGNSLGNNKEHEPSCSYSLKGSGFVVGQLILILILSFSLQLFISDSVNNWYT